MKDDEYPWDQHARLLVVHIRERLSIKFSSDNTTRLVSLKKRRLIMDRYLRRYYGCKILYSVYYGDIGENPYALKFSPPERRLDFTFKALREESK